MAEGDDGGEERDAPEPADAVPGPQPESADDDLDGYETTMSRLVARARGWLALFVAALLVIPLGGWLVQELAFRRSGTAIEEELGGTGLADSVLLVRAARCDGSSGSGSGFVARHGDRTVVVTNRHVVEGARLVGLRPLTGGAALEIATYRVAEGADVAVLEPADPGALAAPLPFGEPVGEGDEVRVVGFPAAMPFATTGTVLEADRARLLLDVRTDPGASGSPVVDGDGRVVGQIHSRTGDGRGVATPVPALADAIAGARPVEPGC